MKRNSQFVLKALNMFAVMGAALVLQACDDDITAFNFYDGAPAPVLTDGAADGKAAGDGQAAGEAGALTDGPTGRTSDSAVRWREARAPSARTGLPSTLGQTAGGRRSLSSRRRRRGGLIPRHHRCRSPMLSDRVPERIAGGRLVLRPVNLRDAAPMFARWAQDPEATRYLSWRAHERIEQTCSFLAVVAAD